MKTPTKTKPLQAYLCTADEPEDTEIVFARTNGGARFPYARQLDWDFRDVTVRRAPEYDAYAPGPVPVSVLLEHSWQFECSACYRMISLSMDFIENYSHEDMLEWARTNAPRIAAVNAFDLENPEPAAPESGCNHRERWAIESQRSDWRVRRERLTSAIYPAPLSRNALRIHDATGECFCDAHCEQQAYAKRAQLEYAHTHATEQAKTRWPGCLEYESNGYPYLNPQIAMTVPGCIYPVHWHPVENEISVANADATAWQAYVSTLTEETDGEDENQAA